ASRQSIPVQTVARAQHRALSDLPCQAYPRAHVVVNRRRHEGLFADQDYVVAERYALQTIAREAWILIQLAASRDGRGPYEPLLIEQVQRVREAVPNYARLRQPVPSQTQVNRQLRFDFPLVLDVERPRAQVEMHLATRWKLAGGAGGETQQGRCQHQPGVARVQRVIGGRAAETEGLKRVDLIARHVDVLVPRPDVVVTLEPVQVGRRAPVRVAPEGIAAITDIRCGGTGKHPLPRSPERCYQPAECVDVLKAKLGCGIVADRAFGL